VAGGNEVGSYGEGDTDSGGWGGDLAGHLEFRLGELRIWFEDEEQLLRILLAFTKKAAEDWEGITAGRLR